MKEKLSSLASKLELLHVEANFVELAPFDTPIEFNPILKLGQLQSVGANIDYNGVDFSRKNRSLYLSVPISEACENDQLIKSLYIWEKWQRVIPVIIRNMRIELEQSLKYLEWQSFFRGLLPGNIILDQLSILHHKINVFQLVDILKRVSFNGNQIC